MATIFGVSDITFAFPEEMVSDQVGSLGRAKDGTFKWLEHRSPDRVIPIHLRLTIQTKMLALKAALEADADHQGTITPDANIDLGNGAGTVVTVQWVDSGFHAVRNNPYWDIDLNFVYLS